MDALQTMGYGLIPIANNYIEPKPRNRQEKNIYFSFKVKNLRTKEEWEQMVPGVHATSKQDYGKHKIAKVEIVGKFVPPQKQYPSSKEAEKGIQETVNALVKEGGARGSKQSQ